MNKQETYDFLDNKNIEYEKLEHKAVYNMRELSDIILPHPEAEAKNLFIRDDKKKNYYLICVKGNKRIDLKSFRNIFKTRPLSFASEKDLLNKLHLTPGSVTPLGLLNNGEADVAFYLDREFLNPPETIAVHPNDNTATVYMNVNDLIRIIKEHGNTVIVF